MSRKSPGEIYEKRIAEVDLLRGLAIVLMLAHHTLYDIRHIFGQDMLAFQDTVWFTDWLRPVILFLFMTVSCISCTFSRNNFKRALRIFLFALGVTLVFEAVSFFTHQELHVWFNVFHQLSLGIFLYAVLTRKEKQSPAPPEGDKLSLLLLVLSMLFLYYGTAAARSPYLSHNVFFIFGLYRPDLPGQADYLPLFPWFGMFLLGAGIGRIFYNEKKSLCSAGCRRVMLRAGRPLLFLGRHPLWVYALHQPILLLLIGLCLKISGRL